MFTEKAADAPQASPKGERKLSTSEVVPEVPAETMPDVKTPTTITITTIAVPPPHVKARASDYPGAPADVKRSEVKDEHVRWSVECSDYSPVRYTAKHILDDKPVWADPDVE